MFIYVFISFVLLVELKKIYMNIQKSLVVEVFVEVGEEVRICLYLFSSFLFLFSTISIVLTCNPRSIPVYGTSVIIPASAVCISH